MDASVTIGPHVFDHVDWDESSDVLYLSKGGPRVVPGLYASPEGHHLRIDESGDLQGVTLVGPRGILEDQGAVLVSMPDGTRIGHAEIADTVTSVADGLGSVEAGSPGSPRPPTARRR